MRKMKKNLLILLSVLGILFTGSNLENADFIKNFYNVKIYAETDNSESIDIKKIPEYSGAPYVTINGGKHSFSDKDSKRIEGYNELDKGESSYKESRIKAENISTYAKKKAKKPKKSKKNQKDNSVKISTHYIANTNTKKFHISTCRYIKQMKAENMLESDNRDDLISSGYKPCKVCQP